MRFLLEQKQIDKKSNNTIDEIKMLSLENAIGSPQLNSRKRGLPDTASYILEGAPAINEAINKQKKT